mmetsp:Transcript_11294/g.10809  ORF Transcript_11294/g.10809 Transcript_11294/m.10809 type:complete len:112 (-) Transcript_11294:302-637(-)|eukprot:CAMPEP_0197832916 /NCGR_PEP_ID=MMETSP1437-20131217/16849_1 /TAXON_ID=49252 ORGANISM="Eucampia antarctica, Strain CCMP1452" /NCGR_SAMPLE_ID=MMETSP1437 /ASSEMBLY_ACC=CAM_ASM_001096 /LENGTH=111 /DNA_ID=CAMNT_0043436577 /DNA_START=72 /DNA_END=407 /DNA_ORIENTATION=+
MTSNQIYVRCKRQNQTFFVHATRLDTVFHVKEQVAIATRKDIDISPRQIRVYTSPTDKASMLSDSATIADHDIQNDQCLYVVFRKDNSKDLSDDNDRAWEEVEVQGMEISD